MESSAFAPIAKELNANRKKIINELEGCQGNAVDMGGYYYPTEETANSAMRPSATFNAIIDSASNWESTSYLKYSRATYHLFVNLPTHSKTNKIKKLDTTGFEPVTFCV